MPGSNDKRRHYRLQNVLPVQVNDHDQTRTRHTMYAQSTNMSLDGIRLKIKQIGKMGRGQHIRLSISPNVADQPIEVGGVVCWVDSSDESHWNFELGIRFTDMDSQHWERWYNLLPGVDNT